MAMAAFALHTHLQSLNWPPSVRTLDNYIYRYIVVELS